jgi:hypothetical protein
VGVGTGLGVGGAGCCWQPITVATGNHVNRITVQRITSLFICDASFIVQPRKFPLA